MDRNFLIVGISEIHVAKSGDFIGLRLTANDNKPVGLGLHPEMTRDLALGLLKALSDGTKSGKLPPRLAPMVEPKAQLRPDKCGIELEFDLSDGLRITSEMPWPLARTLAAQLIALCDDHDAEPSGLN